MVGSIQGRIIPVMATRDFCIIHINRRNYDNWDASGVIVLHLQSIFRAEVQNFSVYVVELFCLHLRLVIRKPEDAKSLFKASANMDSNFTRYYLVFNHNQCFDYDYTTFDLIFVWFLFQASMEFFLDFSSLY